MFGGKGSKTADLDMMHRAMEMRAKGVRPETVWNQTGWFRGPEGMWRYEIPDYDAHMKPSESVRPRTGWMGEKGMEQPTLLKKGELRTSSSILNSAGLSETHGHASLDGAGGEAWQATSRLIGVAQPR
jgi:hypothetical protein